MSESLPVEGVHTLPPREKWTEAARKLRDTYAITPGAPLYQTEFGYYSLERWFSEGLDQNANLAEEFGFDPPGMTSLGQLGWCEAAFVPSFEVKIIEDRGEHEVEQDYAGRHVLYFKGRRSGFMPEYIAHPVKDMKTWEENCKWRMNPHSPERYADLDERMSYAGKCAAQGMMVCQNLIGGYMYLRSLIGPEDLLYAFCLQPDLIHACMTTWFELADTIIAQHQKYVTLDEIYFAEDICYKGGSLISPEMMQEFLMPYYQQLISNTKARQCDPSQHLYMKVDTDGFADPVIPFYRKLGMDAMTPFEVASDCDVLRTGREYPNMALFGGIDKRVLATTTQEIDRCVESILPVMRERGGYVPTCDHGVPEEVSLENYRHYRKRCLELGG